MKDPLDDWWLDPRLDRVGLPPDEPPMTVEQYLARYDDDHVFTLEDVRELAGKVPASHDANALRRRAIRDELVRRCWDAGDVSEPQLARAARLSERTIKSILKSTGRPKPRLVR